MLVNRVIELVVKMSRSVVDSVGSGRRYEPPKHYMRGPGPKSAEAARRQSSGAAGAR